MTRKTCTNQPHVDILLQSVCPKLFCFYHSHLGYIKTVTRQRITGICSSYVNLNNLYGTNSAFKLFLKINGIALNHDQEETKSLIQTTRRISMARNKMPRTRTNSVCYKVKQLPHHNHRLRARRHTTFTNSFADTSGDDDSNHVKSMRELRSSSRLSLAQVKATEQEQDTWESGRPKRACIKQKRISADERLVVDNKNYYKVEVMRNKLRSSDVVHRETEVSVVKKIKSPLLSEDSEDDKGLLVKFPSKKLRNAELTRLNNEAENFLFPRKDESSSEDDTDADGSNTSPVNSKKGDHSVLSSDSSSKPNKSSKNEPEEESSMDSTSSELSSSTRKRRRLTQAEAFILDNQRYYKFETPGSRLRYQGSYLAPIPKNNGEYSTNKHSRNKEHHTESIKPKLDLNELKFSFEVVPKMEAWYKTFQRQDNGEEYYSCYSYSNPGFYKPFLLPYEMGPLPPLDPKVCLYNYNQMKKHFLGDNAATASAACISPNSCSADTPAKVDELSSTGEDTKSSEDSMLASDCTESFFRKSKPSPRQGQSRRGAFGASKNPRKSPRQHASTLAILSSLIHQRKRRETHKSRGSDQNSSKHNLSTITEEGKEQEPQEPEPDYEEIAKNITDMLANCMEPLDAVGTSSEDGVDVNVHCKPDAIQALQDFVHYKEDYDGPTIAASKLTGDSSTVRKPYRKKKKNRTGWPNKNRRTAFRKEGSDSRDGLGSSEHDNSVANSPSVHAEFEGNEENVEDNNCNKNRKNISLSKLSSYIEVTNDSRSTSIDKINGDVQVQASNKINGINDSYELNFRSLATPKRKEHRESSSDNCAEVVIASVGDKIDCVNVGLDEWENAERVLAAKLRSEAINNDIQFQPIVRVQKLDSDTVKRTEKRLRNSPSPRRTRPRRMPASPKSPRMLRRPRGGWYRERFNNNN